MADCQHLTAFAANRPFKYRRRLTDRNESSTQCDGAHFRNQLRPLANFECQVSSQSRSHFLVYASGDTPSATRKRATML